MFDLYFSISDFCLCPFILFFREGDREGSWLCRTCEDLVGSLTPFSMIRKWSDAKGAFLFFFSSSFPKLQQFQCLSPHSQHLGMLINVCLQLEP